MANLLGPFLVLTFCLSQAFRDVYFAQVFQGIDFFSIILLAFFLSTLIFGILTAIRFPTEFAKLRDHISTVIGMNVTTAIAWTCYFFALKHLEPAIVNTLHSGMAPLTVIGLGMFEIKLAKRGVVSSFEYLCYGGIALSLAGLCAVVLSDLSGLPLENFWISLAGLASLLVSGASITISLLYSKHLHDHGVNAEAVTAVRYLLIIALAACVEVFRDGPQGFGSLRDLPILSAATILLIVVPTFALQLGVARTAALTAHIIRSLGPVSVFVLEKIDHRISYSAPTLACVIVYSICVIASNIAHGWRDASGPVAVARALD